MWTFLKINKGTGAPLDIINPCSGQLLQRIPTYREAEIEEALKRARKAQRQWANTRLDERIAVLTRFQHILAHKADEVCRLMALENGKPLQESLQTEVMVVNFLANYFLKRGKKLLANRTIPLQLLKYRRSYINYRPRGVVLVISPWNYPFSIPVGTIFMALLAGNAVVHKPASLTPLIALKTRALFDLAGLDPDLYQVLPCSGALAGKMLDMGVDFVNFTGSTEVGLQISQECGRRLIPCSMELGGKDAAIVCADADIDRAAMNIVFGALTNAGQTCASVERVYAHEAIYAALVDKILARVRVLRMGDPLETASDMGPMVDPQQIPIIEHQIQDAVARGAQILHGGKRWAGPGSFFEPTVLTNVTDDMLVMREETFGPLIPIMKVSSPEEAVARANDSIYGLNAYIFTKNKRLARELAEQIQAGTVMINETLITFGIPETPWQGVKMSGTGRTHSDEGLLHLCYPYHVNEEASVSINWNPFAQPYSDSTYRFLKLIIQTMFGDKKQAITAWPKWDKVKWLLKPANEKLPLEP